MGLHTFNKSERLCSKKSIQELFHKGFSFYIYPFKVIHLPDLQGTIDCHQILISVPKRAFKEAVDRNLIKRRIREAYRQNKELLSLSDCKPQMIAYIYTSKETLNYQQINTKLKDTLIRLEKECLISNNTE